MNLDEFFKYSETSLRGKRAIVTGASAGFGLAIACRLAAEGCDLVLVARRKEALESLAEGLRSRFPSLAIEVVAGDVRDPALFEEMATRGHFDADILVNNAGLARGLDPVESANLEHWQEMIDTNLTAAFRFMREAVPRMVARGGGHIVNMGSVAGHESYEKGSVYCATKHGLIAFSKALRQEVCGKNVRVTVVSPGMAKTEFSLVRFSGDAERAEAVYQGVTPLTAHDIAHEVLFCLKQPSHVNVDELLVMPTQQGAAGKVARRG